MCKQCVPGLFFSSLHEARRASLCAKKEGLETGPKLQFLPSNLATSPQCHVLKFHTLNYYFRTRGRGHGAREGMSAGGEMRGGEGLTQQ